MPFGRIQRWRKYRGEDHIDPVVHSGLEKRFHDFPVAVGKNIYMIVYRQTVRVKPLGQLEGLLRQHCGDDLGCKICLCKKLIFMAAQDKMDG